MNRKAAFAGRFYPDDPVLLRQTISRFASKMSGPRIAKALIVPHSGYQFSGRIACRTFAGATLPHRFILLGPNHTGEGAPISILSRGVWETPLGTVQIDRQLALAIRRHCLMVQECPSAHRREHGVEIQLPFLQFLLDGDLTFVPLSLGTRSKSSLVGLGRCLAETLSSQGEEVLLVASSDMNHFEPVDRTREKDRRAVEMIRRLDVEALYRAVQDGQTSMCGFGPVIAVMEAARSLGASTAELVDYGHSGEITGESSSVVGYAGLVIH